MGKHIVTMIEARSALKISLVILKERDLMEGPEVDWRTILYRILKKWVPV